MNRIANLNVNSDLMDGKFNSLGNNSVESVVVVSGVVDGSDGAIRFDEAVLSLYNVSFSGFVLRFDISGVSVMNSILERIVWWSLII